jgi:AcrR family transcriptional regulator
MTSRPGRRPGPSGTREAVLEAARQSFAASGYAATTIRRVATDAGVDPSLVMQFHGTKKQLFLDALVMPFDRTPTINELAAGPKRTVGRRLATFLTEAWEDPATRAIFLGRVRAAATEPEGAALVREQIADDLVVPLLRALGADQVELRAGLVSSALIGLFMTRWIIEVDGLKDLGSEELTRHLGPVLQRYMVDPV